MTGRHENNFNLLRMLAALLVMVSHSFPIALGRGILEPLAAFAPANLGRLCVFAFFGMSGFLMMGSLARNRSAANFIAGRALRIMPGLALVALLTAMVLGPLISSTPGYFRQTETWAYVPDVLSFDWHRHHLPGVFLSNPLRADVNSSLWTLRFEVFCYAGLLLASIVGALRPLFFLPAFALIYGWLWTIPNGSGDDLSLCFVYGMMTYFRPALREWPMAAIFMLAAVGSSAAGYKIPQLWSFAIISSAVWFGCARMKLLLPYNRLGDYSYGVYIYGFVVQQVMILLVPGLSPVQLAACAIPVAIGLGVLSWRFIEAPAMRLREPIMEQLADLAAKFAPLRRLPVSSG